MSSDEIMRKDANGQEISKKNKNYHISFNNYIDIIYIDNYKVFNKLEDDENDDYNDYLDRQVINNIRTGNEVYKDDRIDSDYCTHCDSDSIKNCCFIY